MQMNKNTVHIGIIGFGPKGLFGFERLLANLKNLSSGHVHIHLFNSSDKFASGWIYDPQQPGYLKMNYPNRLISLEPPCQPASLCDLQGFSKWQAERKCSSQENENYTIASRAEVGAYFLHYFKKLCKGVNPSIKIHKHRLKVKKISKKKKAYILHTSDEGFESPNFSSLLITTGHSPSITSKLSRAAASENHVPFIYPVDKQLTAIKAESAVVCKGMGLTAIDAVLALTEGRSGKFETTEKGVTIYKASGKEPAKIYLYSVSGNPIIPRNARNTFSQHSFFFKRFVEKISSFDQLDFETDLFPFIEKDIIGEYYFQLFKKYGEHLNLDQSFSEVQKALASFHFRYPTVRKFEPSRLLQPDFDDAFLDEHLKNYWKKWLMEIEDQNSPLVAAAQTWKHLSEDFNRLYSNECLTPFSKLKFTKLYFPLFNRIAYGPPEINMKKMLALAEGGILDFSFAKNPSFHKNEIIKKLEFKTRASKFDFSIDARIPRGYQKTAPVLFTKSKSVFSFKNDASNENYAHHLKCNKQGNPINPEGNPEFNITLYGTPTEGFLFDNDSLSRTRNDTASLWAQSTAENITLNFKKTQNET